MRVLVIGATGFVGAGVARALLSDGHIVSGLARTSTAAEALTAAGVGPIEGNLVDLDALCDTAKRFDALVFAPMIPYEAELPILTALLQAYSASSRTGGVYRNVPKVAVSRG